MKEKQTVTNLWEEFIVMKEVKPGMGAVPMCGICGGTGIFDTRGQAPSPTGVDCGSRNYCICPNGRYNKKHKLQA